MGRGEEKTIGSKGDPELELVSKFLWTYHGLPYIPRYHANGMTIIITILYFSGVVKAKDLWTFNLPKLGHHVHMVLACLNVVKNLPILGLLCNNHNLESNTMVIGGEREGKLVLLYHKNKSYLFSLPHIFNIVQFDYIQLHLAILSLQVSCCTN